MARILRVLRDYATSLAGRITLLLAVGIAAASILSLFVADHLRIWALYHMQREQVVASTADMAERFTRDAQTTQARLDRHELYGVRNALFAMTLRPADTRLSGMLADRLGPAAQARVREITSNCFGEMFDARNRVAGQMAGPPVNCWLVDFRDHLGRPHHIVVDLPTLQIPQSGMLDPAYLVLILLTSALLAGCAARLTTVPLRRLTRAARRFSVSLDPETIAETGPGEVRIALATFNLMQQRVRDGFRERTQILAAIAHDLQTPLTRMRLRLEQVEEEALRNRLVADMGAMQALVKDGLELARCTEIREEWSLVDLDSLVASLVEDRAEMGQEVTLVERCDVLVRVKPNALFRCLDNLVGNAVKYGGVAHVSCRRSGDGVVIAVRDNGPGIAPDRLEEMFEPFVRGDSSRSRATGGTGIGLTIARGQAHSFGATIALANRPEGGLIATICFPVAPTA